MKKVMTEYLTTSILLLSISCFTLSKYFYLQWLARVNSTVSFMSMDVVVKLIICLYAFLYVPIVSLFPNNFFLEVCGGVVGLLVGYLQVWLEKRLMRTDANLKKPKPIALGNHPAVIVSKITEAKKSFSSRSQKEGLFDPIIIFNTSLTSLIIVAVLEEFIYRGNCTYLINAFTSCKIIKVIFLVLIAAFFSFSHVSFSWRQVGARFIFALQLLGLIIFSHSILPCVVAHIYLNCAGYVEVKKCKAINSRLNASGFLL